MSLTIKWDITYKCNLNCDHCLNGDLLYKLENELTTEEAIQTIENMAEADVFYVYLLGGEPTARRDLVEITNHFREKEIGFGFNTNGLKMDSPDLIEIMQNPYLRNVIISLEGPNAEINDKIRGKDVFEKVTAGLRKFIQFKNEHELDHFYITINTVVSKQNMEHIPQMLEMCVDLGVGEFKLLEYIDSGNADKKNSLTVPEELELLKKLGARYQEYRDQIKLKPRFLRPIGVDYVNKVLGLDFPVVTHACGAGTTFAFMNNRGELYPCDRYLTPV